MIKHILFDLDGTLTDPGAGITRSVQYALKKYGIEVDDLTGLYPFIGPPLKESFQKFFGFDQAEAREAVAAYREYFSERGIYENQLYQGVAEMLERLRSAGQTLLLATSKPTVYAEKILRHFKIDEYFQFISGSELDGSRTDKAEVIEQALEQSRVSDRTRAIMVGDREHDVIGAKKAGLAVIGVLYGYGDREELSRAGADFIVADPPALAEKLASLGRPD